MQNFKTERHNQYVSWETYFMYLGKEFVKFNLIYGLVALKYLLFPETAVLQNKFNL